MVQQTNVMLTNRTDSNPLQNTQNHQVISQLLMRCVKSVDNFGSFI